MVGTNGNADLSQIHRDLGATEARLAALQAQLDEISKSVHQLNEFAAEIRGGKKVVAVIWLALGSVLTFVLTKLFGEVP